MLSGIQSQYICNLNAKRKRIKTVLSAENDFCAGIFFSTVYITLKLKLEHEKAECVVHFRICF